jgi:hypothetical protein
MPVDPLNTNPMKKTIKPAESHPADHSKSSHLARHPEIKTEHPLSEKDELKQAEERMRKAAKNS